MALSIGLCHSGLQAIRSGNILRAHGYQFDEAHTSVLKRAVRTLWHVLDNMNLMHITGEGAGRH